MDRDEWLVQARWRGSDRASRQVALAAMHEVGAFVRRCVTVAADPHGVRRVRVAWGGGHWPRHGVALPSERGWEGDTVWRHACEAFVAGSVNALTLESPRPGACRDADVRAGVAASGRGELARTSVWCAVGTSAISRIRRDEQSDPMRVLLAEDALASAAERTTRLRAWSPVGAPIE